MSGAGPGRTTGGTAGLPATGRPAAAVLADLDAMRADDVDIAAGRAFSLAYLAGPELHALAAAAHDRFLEANALNPFAFPSLGRLQAEVVAMVAALCHGGPGAAGFLTSGGTESLLMAVKAAREWGRAQGIEAPRVVVPASAHAAFTKAAHYFGVELARVPVRDDWRADPEAMAAACDGRTVLVVASAPAYPQGVIDPVADIAALAARRGICCHVDACMGGMLLPFMERLGEPVAPWDFRVPGVTSISVDLHKYGYAPKGASVILYRSRELRSHQTFATDDWLGGFYASPGIAGTRGGGPIAAAWAVLQHLGHDGYLRLTRRALDAARRLVSGLRALPGVTVLGEPDATLVAFTFDDADAFAVGRALWARGWYVDQQGPPPSLHATVHAGHADVIDEFLAALADSLAEVQADGSSAAPVPYAATEAPPGPGRDAPSVGPGYSPGGR